MNNFSIFPKLKSEFFSTLSPINTYLSLKTETENGNPCKFISRWTDDGSTPYIGEVEQNRFVIKRKFTPGILKFSKTLRPLITGEISPNGNGSKISITYQADTYQSVITMIFAAIFLSVFASFFVMQISTGDYLFAVISFLIEILFMSSIYFSNYITYKTITNALNKELSTIFLEQSFK